MNHPTNEEWMDYLYGELPAGRRRVLQKHLDTCAECHQQWRTWNGSKNALDDWRWDAQRSSRRERPGLAWAAAAAVLLGIGIAIGHWTSPGATELKSMRAALEQEFRSQLQSARRELAEQVVANALEESSVSTERALEEFAQSQFERRTEDLQSVAVALEQLDSQRRQDQESLRRALETVAVETEDSLIQLAGAGAGTGPR